MKITHKIYAQTLLIRDAQEIKIRPVAVVPRQRYFKGRGVDGNFFCIIANCVFHFSILSFRRQKWGKRGFADLVRPSNSHNYLPFHEDVCFLFEFSQVLDGRTMSATLIFFAIFGVFSSLRQTPYTIHPCYELQWTKDKDIDSDCSLCSTPV